MGDFFNSLFGDEKSEQNNQNSDQNSEQSTSSMSSQEPMSSQDSQENGTLQLHKEELDITKNKVDAGEVVLSKEIVEEEKTVSVPVMHEEVVINRTPIQNERSDSSAISSETIRIPVTKEQVEVNKYTVTTEEISASVQEVQETQEVHDTLRHEEAHIDSTGDVIQADHTSS